jgi:hypothetical protein
VAATYQEIADHLNRDGVALRKPRATRFSLGANDWESLANAMACLGEPWQAVRDSSGEPLPSSQPNNRQPFVPCITNNRIVKIVFSADAQLEGVVE